MVCSRCTLLHPDFAVRCSRCGTLLRPPVQHITALITERAPLCVGVISGGSLLLCLALSLIVPAIAAQALSIGAYLGLFSIGNVWLAVYRDEQGEWLRGARGVAYSGALLFSLVGELARLQNLHTLALPALPGLPANVPVPSAFVTEVVAAALIVLDPLVVAPLIRWIEAGVERGEPDAESLAGGPTQASISYQPVALIPLSTETR